MRKNIEISILDSIVGKNAFKNTKKNVVIKVKTSAKNFEKNKTLLEKSGLPKNATVKRVKIKK